MLWGLGVHVVNADRAKADQVRCQPAWIEMQQTGRIHCVGGLCNVTRENDPIPLQAGEYRYKAANYWLITKPHSISSSAATIANPATFAHPRFASRPNAIRANPAAPSEHAMNAIPMTSAGSLLSGLCGQRTQDAIAKMWIRTIKMQTTASGNRTQGDAIAAAAREGERGDSYGFGSMPAHSTAHEKAPPGEAG